MKLHLPKSLLCAVLAVSSVSYASVSSEIDSTTGYTTYTWSGSDSGNNSMDLSSYTENDTVVFKLQADNRTNNYFPNANNNVTAAKVVISDDNLEDQIITGLILTNGWTNSHQIFTGALEGNGAIQKTKNGTNNTITFEGDATNYTGNIYLHSSSNGPNFTLTFGGRTDSTVITAPETSAQKGAAGTGDVEFKEDKNTLKFNYASDGNVYITNKITDANTGNNANSNLVARGGADYIFTKDVTVDKLTVSGGSASFSENLSVGALVGTGNIYLKDSTLGVATTKSLTIGTTEIGTTGGNEAVPFTGRVNIADSDKLTVNLGVAEDITAYLDGVRSLTNTKLTVRLQDGATLLGDMTGDNRSISINTLSVSGSAHLGTRGATDSSTYKGYQGKFIINNLTNVKDDVADTITLSSNSNTSQRTIFDLEGGDYEGIITVHMEQSNAGRKIALNINNKDAAKDSVINLTSNGGAVALGIGAPEVKVKGITGTTGTIYAGAQNFGSGDDFSADGAEHTLVVNTAGEDYATSAAIVGKKDGEGNLHLTKHGAGKQSFNGNNQLGDVKVTGGELSFGGATTMGDLTLEQDNTNSAGVTSRAVTFAANSTIGDIDAKTAGNLNFKLATGSTSTTYAAGTIKTTANNGMGFNMGIDSGVTVNAASFMNDWGMGTLTVDGELNLSGMLKFATGSGDGNRITGNGSISSDSAEFGNVGTYNISVKQLTVEGEFLLSSYGSDSNTNINSGANVLVKGELKDSSWGWGDAPKLNIMGGNLELQGGGTVDQAIINISNGSLVQAGGTTTVSTDFSMTGGELKVTAGELKAGDKFSATGGKLNVAGGILSIGTGSVVTDGTTVAAAAQLSYGNGALSITGNNATADMGAVSFRMVEDEVVLAGGVADNALIALMEGASLKLENVTLGAGTQINGAAAIATVDADGSVSSTGNALTLADTTVQIANTSTKVLSDPLSSEMALALDLSTDVKGIAVTASTFANVSLTGEMELNITGDLISELIQGDYKYVAITFEPSVTWSTETVTITGASFGNGQPAGGVVINNGTIYVSVPEPTTATLSLLALAALAARRRRK